MSEVVACELYSVSAQALDPQSTRVKQRIKEKLS